jgi:hypothetical protein
MIQLELIAQIEQKVNILGRHLLFVLWNKIEDSGPQTEAVKMCDSCKKDYPGFLFAHAVQDCPFKRSLYCSSCACYGHSGDECPAKPADFYTKPCFIEQLIPLSVRQAHNITTRTLLPEVMPFASKEGILEIEDDIGVIRAYLQARSLLKNRQTSNAVLKDLLHEYAKQQNKRLMFVS